MDIKLATRDLDYTMLSFPLHKEVGSRAGKPFSLIEAHDLIRPRQP